MREELQGVLNSMTTDMHTRFKYIGTGRNGIDVYRTIPTVTRKSSLEDFVKLTTDVILPDDIDINVSDFGTGIGISSTNGCGCIDRVFRTVTIDGNDIDENLVYSLIAISRKENLVYGYHGHVDEKWESDLSAYFRYQYVDISVLTRALKDKKVYPFEGFEILVTESTPMQFTCIVKMRDDIQYRVTIKDGWLCDVMYTTPEYSKEMDVIPAGVARAIVTFVNSR